MSAAEKLKALDKAMPHAPTHIATWPLFWEFRSALPQIVALVETIETALDQDHGDGIPTMAIGDALVALEEALETK